MMDAPISGQSHTLCLLVLPSITSTLVLLAPQTTAPPAYHWKKVKLGQEQVDLFLGHNGALQKKATGVLLHEHGIHVCRRLIYAGSTSRLVVQHGC